MRPPMGLPLSMSSNGPMDGSYRFQPQGPMLLRGAPGGMVRPPMHIAFGPRGPMSGGPMVLGRMPGPPSQQHVLVMQQPHRPGLPPNMNGPPLVRQPMRPGAPGKTNQQTNISFLTMIDRFCLFLGMPANPTAMSVMPGQHPTNYYAGQSVTGQGVRMIYFHSIFVL